MKSALLHSYDLTFAGRGCCRVLNAKHGAITAAIYSLNISVLVVLIYSWRISVNLKNFKSLEDVYYGVQIAYFGIIGTQLFMIVLSIVLLIGIYRVLTVHATITWAMNDVFIIILSSALALNFKQLAKRLGDEVFKVKSDTFWQQIREDYDTLSNLCKEVNLNISHIIMLSYTTNIFFILVQLFHSLETNVYTDTISKVYFAFSFMYLFFKVVTVSLYSAWINEESKQPAYILTCLPSESYNIEENYNLVIPWVIGFITFMALEAVSMVYSNVLRDHVNREFDALCKAEVAFFISRAVINIFAISAVMKFSTLLQAGITWKGPEEIEL